MSAFNMQGQNVENQFIVSPKDSEVKQYITLYQQKIDNQKILEKDLVARIRRMRGRREDYSLEAVELKEVRARKQCYVQAQADFQNLLEC